MVNLCDKKKKIDYYLIFFLHFNYVHVQIIFLYLLNDFELRKGFGNRE